MALEFREYRRWDGMEMARLVRSGELHPSELLQVALDRAHNVNEELGAITFFFEEIAKREISTLDRQAPFYGTPFLLKDLFSYMPGTPLSNGTRLYPVEYSDQESTLVRRFRDCGFITFGKTASPEFGLNVVTEPAAFGPCRNPWDTSRSPGGSSGGAASAVSSGIVPMAHASDGGGSIRIPASACGLFGFKPSRGVMPSGPLVGEGWNGLATSHVISRSVRDSAAVLAFAGGSEAGSPYASPEIDIDLQKLTENPCRPLRIALVTTPVVDVPIDQACVDAAQHVAQLLQEMGHEIEPTNIEIDEAVFSNAFLTVVMSNLNNDLEIIRTRMGNNFDEKRLEHCTRLMAEQGRGISGRQLLEAIRNLHRIGRKLGQFFAHYDMVLSPTMAALPPSIDEIQQNEPDLEAFFEQNRPYTAFTAMYNAIGCPAVSVPLYKHEGLPVGTMLASALGRDALLLDVCADLEAARPWMHHTPTLSFDE